MTEITQVLVPLSQIDPNPWQTRSQEDPVHIEELAHSIRAVGLMQVPSARKVEGGYAADGTTEIRYQLAFGHSRLAAYKLLLTLGYYEFREFPLVVKELTDEQIAIAAFEENDKRKDLNPVERAQAVKNMVTSFGWTQQLVAEKLHIDRSSVSNMIRLLNLPDEVLGPVETGLLPVRSAMALLPFYELTELEKPVVEERYQGEVEEFVAMARSGQVSSDVIREKLTGYLAFLYPTQMKLEDQPVVVEGDSITAVDETEGRSVADEIEAIPDDDTVSIAETFGDETSDDLEDTSAPAWIEAEEERQAELSAKSSTPTSLTATVTEAAASTTVPAPVKPTESTPGRPVLDSSNPASSTPETTVVSSSDTLFTITWNENGQAMVGLRKPGAVVPALKFLQSLGIDEIPGLLREMGLE